MPGSRRERELERERRRRQERARAERAERRQKIGIYAGGGTAVVVVIVLIVLAATGVFSGSSGTPTASATTPTAGSPSASATTASDSCSFTPHTAGTATSTPTLPPTTPLTGTHTATITLQQGTLTGKVVIALSPKTPCTNRSFDFLAGRKFFDDTTCLRLTTSSIFVLQCGDPTGTGEGGPGYTIPDENLAGATYPAGTVAMANAGQAHTGGSQFFLVYKDTPLPPQYTPFGKITSGLDVIQKIAAVGQTNSNGPGDGKPKETVKILSFRVS